jgi:hypothetical protein
VPASPHIALQPREASTVPGTRQVFTTAIKPSNNKSAHPAIQITATILGERTDRNASTASIIAARSSRPSTYHGRRCKEDFLIEKYSIRYVASGRDLLREREPTAPPLLAVFGKDFR